MKYILALLLLASPAYAQEKPHYLQGIFDMAHTYQYGQMQNQLAKEAPPIKYQIETINKNPAPNYYFGSSGGIDLNKLAEALKKAETVEFKDSPFNDSFMPEVEE